MEEDHFYLGVPPLPKVLENIAAMSDAQVATLADEVRKGGFARSRARCESIANELGAEVRPREAFGVLAALDFFYDRSRDWEEEGRDAATELRDFLDVTGLIESLGTEPSRQVSRLTALVSRNPHVEKRKKLRWLRTGLLDTAVDFSSFVDLRPSFSTDRSAIDEIIPAVIVRIATESDRGEDRAHVFQLTAEGVSKLRKLVEDIEKKLKLLNTDITVGTDVLGTNSNEGAK